MTELLGSRLEPLREEALIVAMTLALLDAVPTIAKS
jgi:hypothetical protein